MISSTTTSTTAARSLTMDDLERAAQLVRSMPPEPIGKWMLSKGFPPSKWRLVLPEKMREPLDGPVFWPDYVSFSTTLDMPVFVRRGIIAKAMP